MSACGGKECRRVFDGELITRYLYARGLMRVAASHRLFSARPRTYTSDSGALMRNSSP
ncbi:hypothetical protein LMG27177_03375 [Paraburkholderia fynbosensis]|uniref:Uncharacterized protein n=1 Tax=Paraburkholderia fynbosensis TaxID=1200993 RepID=A0A6J5G6X3_9BURK|nr:hypothetical protein LMG27177_03375 [Paraburkholderia fynbosensis]